MIDTDKYEGHNMHRALLDVGEDYNNWDALQDMGFNDEARQLIADAPLLLAEVERLREQLKEANDVIQYALEMSSDDDSTRVFEDYLEVIE
jgi:hypothetical protein